MMFPFHSKGFYMIKHSTYQENLFAEASKQSGNIMVNAVAGSGKTYSIIECMKRTHGDSVFVAFNKSIAQELESRVPANVTTSTLHSFGLRCIHKNIRGYKKIDNRKIDFLMNDIPALAIQKSMTPYEKAMTYKTRATVKALVSNWKNTLIDYNDSRLVLETAAFYGIDCEPETIPAAKSLMEKSIKVTKYLDFDDMIYLPAINVNRWNIPTFSNVFVDECQDLNRCQIELVLAMVKQPNGRIIAVGDPHQSIYGFRGADIEAMPRMKEALDIQEYMPLSVCYRCPKSHIELAKEIVPHIEAAPNATEGTIETIDEKEFTSKVDKEETPALVLSRTNAPLVSAAIKMITEGRKAFIRGADIGNKLRGIIQSFKANNLAELLEAIDNWEKKKMEAYDMRFASQSVKEQIIDEAEVMRIFTNQATSPEHVIQIIENMFKETKDATIFSSVHKAKGLENETVYILKPNKLPLTWKDQQEWEIEQEMNIKYVALTRSKNKLVFVKEA